MESRESVEDFTARVGRMRVAELLRLYPGSRPVLYNHFGESCFECPAQEEETVELAVQVHRSLREEFYRDLYHEIESGKLPGT